MKTRKILAFLLAFILTLTLIPTNFVLAATLPTVETVGHYVNGKNVSLYVKITAYGTYDLPNQLGFWLNRNGSLYGTYYVNDNSGLWNTYRKGEEYSVFIANLPEGNYEYRAFCASREWSGSVQGARKTFTIQAQTNPQITNFQASRNTITEGESVSLSYSVNADVRSVNIRVNGTYWASQTMGVSRNYTTDHIPADWLRIGSNTIDIRPVDRNGNEHIAFARQITVTVNRKPEPQPSPQITNFSANRNTITEGEGVNLSYTVNADVARVNIRINGVYWASQTMDSRVSRNYTTDSISHDWLAIGNNTIEIRPVDRSGNEHIVFARQTTVTVNRKPEPQPNPQITNFSASRNTITEGESVSLSYSVNADVKSVNIRINGVYWASQTMDWRTSYTTDLISHDWLAIGNNIIEIRPVDRNGNEHITFARQTTVTANRKPEPQPNPQVSGLRASKNPITEGESVSFSYSVNVDVKSCVIYVNDVYWAQQTMGVQMSYTTDPINWLGAGSHTIEIRPIDRNNKEHGILAAQQITIIVNPTPIVEIPPVNHPNENVIPPETINKLIMPIEGGPNVKEAGYAGDSGLDISAPAGTTVYAAANGQIIYSEPGHTKWNKGKDTANSILIKLDTPIIYNGKTAYYIWYTHLSEYTYYVKEGSPTKWVAAGTIIGKSGYGNQDPHLHFGVIINRAQSQSSHYFSMEEVRGLLGLTKGQQIPKSGVSILTASINETLMQENYEYSDFGKTSDIAVLEQDKLIATPSYTVIFIDWDGSVLRTQAVNQYDNATPPVNPSRSGYTFTGWSANYSSVTSDLMVYAQYEYNPQNNNDSTTVEIAEELFIPTILDIVYAMEYLVGNRTLTEQQLLDYNVTKSGTLTMLDIIMMLEMITS